MTRTSLRELIDRRGPFVSVYFDSSQAVGDTARQTELRYRSVREKLSAAGASEQQLGALGIAVAAGPPAPGRSGRALIADQRTVLVDEQLPVPPPSDIVRVSPLPHLLPLLEQRAPVIPHVAARVERAGARLYAVDRHGDTVAHMTGSLGQPPLPARGVRGQRAMRRRGPDAVGRTLDIVAARMLELANRVDAMLILVAGEPTVRAGLRTAVEIRLGAGTTVDGDPPDARHRRLVEIDAETETIPEQVRKNVTEAAETHCDAVLERYRTQRARFGGPTTGGLAETAAALREVRVSCLLIDGGGLDERRVLVGASHTDVATSAHDLDGPAEVRRADEALPVAALAGGSEILPLTGRLTLPDGVGALLREH
ncbi:hypothetical protein LTV02_14705 [Nocardia yamanashiensis]|uniref:baeRF2 domain-containing protein n=1 Tax=Nocardia yamanashiensis TaxID=209247 RepID=UPI001E623B61|nr:hypothetical protein [Nocardia yamanashiensis]UGT44559.1 hypothetical protein LTV02_14705 [Nocardia yamanashiensis]